jgi:hypothetical protein
LLANEKLLNKLVTIVFEKTNMYDCATVIKCIQLLDGYLGFLSTSKKSFPTTFNFTYFFAGIKHILDSDHCFAVSKCLLMLYNHFNLLSLDCRRDITFLLLGKIFFKMFLNWSYNVRVIFQHFVMFRIYLQTNTLPHALREMPTDSTNIQKQLLFNE